MPTLFPEPRALTVVQHVQDVIRSGALPPGSPLPSEGQLSQQLGISRGMVREGYRMLAATGAVELSNGRAPRVAGLDPAPLAAMVRHVLDTQQVTVQDVLQVRRAIELQVAPLAAQHRSEEQARALLTTSDAMRDADDLLPLDLTFHDLLAESSGNPLFILIARSIRAVTQQSIRQGQHHYTDPYHRAEFAGTHARIARAIAQRDPAESQRAMLVHYEQADLATQL